MLRGEILLRVEQVENDLLDDIRFKVSASGVLLKL
jgi:hypothetical protein